MSQGVLVSPNLVCKMPQLLHGCEQPAAAAVVESDSRVVRKEKIFRARLTGQGMICVALLLVPAVLAMVRSAHLAQAGQTQAAALILVVDGLLLLGAGRLAMHHLRCAISVTPEALLVAGPDCLVRLPWEAIKIIEAGRPGGIGVATVSDGDRQVRFNSLTFSDFDLLLRLVQVARKARATQATDCYVL